MTNLEVAITQIGKEEIPRGSNWGEDVRKYLLSVGIPFPASWCMAFVYWCVEEACKINEQPNPLYKTGGVLAQWKNVNEKYKCGYASMADYQAGDIFIMNFGNGLGHCGFVEFEDAEGIHTIEGNTNDTGSREGYEVCRRVRNKKTFNGAIRI